MHLCLINKHIPCEQIIVTENAHVPKTDLYGRLLILGSDSRLYTNETNTAAFLSDISKRPNINNKLGDMA